MPNYSYQCKKCQKEFDKYVPVDVRDEVRCCGVLAHRKIASPSVQAFKPYTHHNLGFNPVRIESKRQEIAEHKKRGLIDAR